MKSLLKNMKMDKKRNSTIKICKINNLGGDKFKLFKI